MRSRILMVLMVLSSVWGQSSLDILNTPNDARAAALGLSQSLLQKPARILSHPEQRIELTVWNWVAGIQGASLGIGLDGLYLGFQALNSGDLEYRDDIPTVDPLSTFTYTLFHSGVAYARQLADLNLGVGLEYLYERTLNASAGGLSINFSGAYSFGEKMILSSGFRHLGFTQNLDEASTELPSELWLELDLKLARLELISEVNSGDIPFTLGCSYPLLDRFELLASIQLEPAEPSLKVHPSAGFTADWDNFILGYTIYQFDHTLGPRHFVTIYWNY